MGREETGHIWSIPPHSRGQIVRRVCEKLEEKYGLPRHGNPEDPVDDLVYILLSNRTSPRQAQRVFEKLRQRFSSWEKLIQPDLEEIAAIIKPAGLANRRARQLQEVFESILADFGHLRSSELWSKENRALLDYLTSLRGISGKVARCVMLYGLNRKVLPVDAHVHRIAFRLGWTQRNRPGESHQELEELIPKDRYFAFHVDCIAHGRSQCKSSNPACQACPIKRYCVYGEGDLAPT